MKKRWRRIGIGLTPLAGVLLLFLLLYIPPSGNFIGRQALRYAGHASGLELKAERLRLSFPLKLTLSGLTARLPEGDTLLSVQGLRLRVALLPLFRQTLSIDELSLQNLRLATGSFVEGLELSGGIDSLSAKALVQLSDEKAVVHSLEIAEAALSLRIDSLSQQEADSLPLNWVVDIGQVRLSRIRLAFQMPSDSLSLSASIERGELIEGGVDLGLSRYTAGRLRLAGSRLTYDVGSLPPSAGLDPSHLALSELHASIDSIVYQGREMNLRIESFAAAERSGLEVRSLGGSLDSDSSRIRIPGLEVRTPTSSAGLQATIPWSVWDERPEGSMQLSLLASIGKQDGLLWAEGLPSDFKKNYPDRPASLRAEVEGNLASLYLKQLKAELPGAFSFSATGKAGQLTDSLRRSAHIRLEAHIRQLDFALNLLPASQREGLRIPQGVSLSGELELKDSEYATALLLTEDKARIELKARYHALRESYVAALAIDSLEPVHFLPGDSLRWLSASFRAEGRGTDWLADSTRGVWRGRIKDLRYGASEVGDISLYGSLENHQAALRLKSNHPSAQMELSFDGSLYPQALKGMLIGDVDSLDLQALRLVDLPFASSFQLFGEMESDLDKNHQADLTLGNWELTMAELPIHPKTLTLHARTDPDTIRLSFHVGDFGIVLTGNADAETMAAKFAGISGDVNRQLKADSSINVAALRPLFPDMSLSVHAEKDNPVYHLLRQYEFDFDAFHLEAAASPAEGLRMDAALYALYSDTFRIDTVRAYIRPDSAGLIYQAEVIKNRYRRQQAFTSQLRGSLQHRYADAELLYTNNQQVTGLQLGARLSQEAGSFNLSLYPDKPVIAFNTFSLNPDNYIRFKNLKEIAANVRFTGKGNSALWLHSHENEGDYPELHVELNQIDMDVVSKGFADMPRIQGMMSADLRYAPSEESFMVVGDAHIDRLIYEGGEVGELMLNTVYLPLDDNTHQVDAHFYRNREEVASATAAYEAGKGDIAGSLAIERLPVEMLSPFIPDQMASLNGALNARLDLGGSASAPVLNGYMQLDTGSVYTGMAASRFRLDDKSIEIKDNRLSLDNYKVYAAGKNPLELSGDIRFADPTRPTAQLRMKGNNLQLLDVKRNAESLVYGRLLVNVDASVQGPLDALAVRGDIHLLGGTNLTYVMKESPLTVQDRLKDLVTFTSFTDTTLRRRRTGVMSQLPVSGMDMLMLIHIDPIVQLHADLTPDQSSYVSLEGGGDLSFQYTRQGEMLLNGRYTLSDGKLKYALPVIPLKEFRIKNDSYIQWDGNPMNPLLSLAATQRMRTSVSLMGESPRMVNFDVGIDVKQRLENMSLLFTIASPEDMSVQAELDKMGAEGRSTQAVGMMVTGLYLANGNNGKVNLNMGDALGNFLQNEISNIAGDALKTVDLSFGVDTYDQESEMGGGQRTDYSFRFAKRFYNDRLRVVIGGKVSSGDVQQKEAFIDNASLEWRLNKAGTGYLKVFHDKNYQSLLDGEVT
ncbi:MAG: translocation/assembly module TamB domain-containing protein, partial [Tannerellaceae bacterium]|nr:translocation/assembly module TamB domain-containing protein [Tannerellaceae bacterium]